MSSARLPMAIAVLGLAACAHTQPADQRFSLPDVRNAAPVVVQDSETVPQGFDDHVVAVVDVNAVRQAVRAQVDPNAMITRRSRATYPLYRSRRTSPVASDPVSGNMARTSAPRSTRTASPSPDTDRASARMGRETR